ncbi:UNVERIFIED_CONTAM: hypothetical protein K2H54_057980 [Gekko kuhli]
MNRDPNDPYASKTRSYIGIAYTGTGKWQQDANSSEQGLEITTTDGVLRSPHGGFCGMATGQSCCYDRMLLVAPRSVLAHTQVPIQWEEPTP